jgi:hypothetical protein
MITLVRGGVKGMTDRGEFAGELRFAPGVTVIQGDNHRGKSTIAASIAWCLGLEVLYGMQKNDPGLFSEAARSQMVYPDGKSVSVLASHAFLEMNIGSTAMILRRSILGGGRPDYVEMELTATGEKRNLLVGQGALADDVGGFQATLFKSAGMPIETVLTPSGRPSSIYFENQAALFFIEQRAGWANVQALQTHRYQQMEIEEATVEYLLGLKLRLAKRREAQKRELEESSRKREISEWAEKVVELALSRGWKLALTPRGTVGELAEKFRGYKLQDVFKHEFNWDFAAEHERLLKVLEELNRRLNAETAPKASDAASSEASTKVVALKHALHDKREQAETLRRQVAAQDQLLRSTKDRIQSAEDLIRLKKSNVGFLAQAECPTCRSLVDPRTFELRAQTSAEVERSIESARRDAEALRYSVRSTNHMLQKLLFEIQAVEREYAAAQRALRMIADANNPNAEGVADLTGRILSAEREIDRAKAFETQLSDLQARLDKWLVDVGVGTTELVDPDAKRREARVVDDFQTTFRKFLGAIGHGDAGRELNEVRLDDRYVPLVGSRRLRSLGSASDQPRMVLSYVWSLMDAAVRNQGWHPGFLLVDEPLQQNPDEHHRKAFCDFVAARAPEEHGQVIIITTLHATEREFFKNSKIPFLDLEDRLILGPAAPG